MHLCKTADEAGSLAGKMLGESLVTKQTGPEGAAVRKVMVCEAVDIAAEKYFSILMDRASNGPVMLASPRGGMDIEKVAAETPEFMFKDPVNIMTGITVEQTEKMAKNLGFEGELVSKAAAEMRALYEMFLATDATQVEINPLAQTKDGQVLCLDAKINFDDNASFRQKEVYALGDSSEDDPREVRAAEHDLNYIGLTGSIACLVNGSWCALLPSPSPLFPDPPLPPTGAGLAMATMDIIELYGGSPANFLDVGGGATEKQVTEAFKILTDDKNVKAILVNIFGGIMRCDVIAAGVVAAARTVDIKVPLVVRLAGTNVDEGLKILADSGLPIIGASDLNDAAQKAVDATK